jgi:hypothetical protein
MTVFFCSSQIDEVKLIRILSKMIILKQKKIAMYSLVWTKFKKFPALRIKWMVLLSQGYFQNGLKPFPCYVKISYDTKEVDQRYLVFT